MLDKYQTAVVDEALNGTESVNVEAVAGSGKTTTIEEAIKALLPSRPPRISYLVFNKANQVEAMERFPESPDLQVVTFNASGHRVLLKKFGYKSINVQSTKTYNIMNALNIASGDESQFARSSIAQLVGIAKNSVVEPFDPGVVFELDTLIGHMGIPFSDDDEKEMIVTGAIKVLQESIRWVEEENIIDFNDQLWYPLLANLQLPKSSHIFVDEAQDLNAARIEWVWRSRTPSARVFIVGDRHQAIYGFTGAHTNAIDYMQSRFETIELPLSISYRCDKAIIQRAQRWVPHIQWRPDAAEGKVRVLTEKETFEMAQFTGSDHIVCRLNGPLFGVAMELLRMRKPFVFLGREIGERLLNILAKVLKMTGRNALDSDSFMSALKAYAEGEMKKLQAKGQRGMMAALEDQVDALITLASAEDIRDTDELKLVLQKIFAGKSGTKLSTVHKAKGLEAPRVFILEPQLMPFWRAEQDWEMEQENNLQYVATTRAMHELVLAPKEFMT